MPKKPKIKDKPPYRKPVHVCDPSSFDRDYLRIEHNYLDLEHEDWGWNNLTPEETYEFFRFIKSMEQLTWAEIKQTPGGRINKGTNHHAIELDNLSDRAQKRLQELNLTTLDSIFSLRTKGIVRIYGARERHIFRPIWHDPLHDHPEKAVYILKKK